MNKKEILSKHETEIIGKIEKKSERKLRARKDPDNKIWLGLGMMGLVGWSITVPTLAGILIGIWVDSMKISPFSWTLMLLLAGLTLGCINVWYWLSKQDKDIHDEEDHHDK